MYSLFVLFLPTVLSIASPQCGCTEYLECAETNAIQKTFPQCVDHCREKHPLPLPKGYVDCLEEWSNQLTKTISCMFKETGPGCTSSIPRPAQERKTEKFKDAVKDKMKMFLEDLGHTWEYTSETAMEMNRCMLRCFYPGRNVCSISMKCTLLMRNETEMADTLFKCGKRSGIGKLEMKSLALCLALITEGNGEMDTEVRDVIEPVKTEQAAHFETEGDQSNVEEEVSTTGYQTPNEKKLSNQLKTRKGKGKHSKGDEKKHRKLGSHDEKGHHVHSKKGQEEIYEKPRDQSEENVDSEENTDRIVTEGMDRIENETSDESEEDRSHSNSESREEQYRIPQEAKYSKAGQEFNTPSTPPPFLPKSTNTQSNTQTAEGYRIPPSVPTTASSTILAADQNTTTLSTTTATEKRCTTLSAIFSLAPSVTFSPQNSTASTRSVIQSTTKAPSSWSLTPPSNPPIWNAAPPTTRTVTYPSLSPPAYPTFPNSIPNSYVTVPRK